MPYPEVLSHFHGYNTMKPTLPMINLWPQVQSKVVTAAATLEKNRVHIYTGAAANLLLPAKAQVGDRLIIVGAGSGVTTITQAAGQSIRHISSTTTVGTGGSLAAGSVRDTIELICTTQDTTWTTLWNKGTWTVT